MKLTILSRGVAVMAATAVVASATVLLASPAYAAGADAASTGGTKPPVMSVEVSYNNDDTALVEEVQVKADETESTRTIREPADRG